MISFNFNCDYLIVTPIDGDLFRIEGQIQGAPLFVMNVEERPQTVMDTKCIPEPSIEPKTQCVKPSEGYILSVEFSEGELKVIGFKPKHLPAFGIYDLAEV